MKRKLAQWLTAAEQAAVSFADKLWAKENRELVIITGALTVLFIGILLLR